MCLQAKEAILFSGEIAEQPLFKVHQFIILGVVNKGSNERLTVERY